MTKRVPTASTAARTIGIRREDKNRWERRVAVTPEAARELIEQHGLKIQVQPSDLRVFGDDEYVAAGAETAADVFGADVVVAVKEIPVQLLREGGTYVFFSHTIKGQPYNMPLLRRLMELGCNLIDYERIVDDKGRRLVFFGRYAGLAGMIDTLSTLALRLDALGRENPFAGIAPAYEYTSLADAERAVTAAGERIRRDGLPADLAPFICGFTGYGNVSQGAQHIYDLLPTEEITPDQLEAVANQADPPRDRLYKVVFREEHIAEPREAGAAFDLADYYANPERYQGIFERYVPHLSALVNGVYWEERYPRILSREYLKGMYANGAAPKLLVVGDISCDIDGSVEATREATEPDAPSFVYDPDTHAIQMGVEGRGLAVMAVDNLPCELPREASETFSASFAPFVPAIARADFDRHLADLDLPAPVRSALVLHNGELTPEYRYMQEFLEQ